MKLTSFDINNVYNKIPINETIQIIKKIQDNLSNNNKRNTLKSLFINEIIKQNYFEQNEQY